MARKTADDFRTSCGIFGHPKFKKLRRRGGDTVALSLFALWAWATLNRSDGNLAGLTDEDIEDAIDWTPAPGSALAEPGSMVALLVELRWIDGPPLQRVLHEWFEHNPYAATKAARVRRAQAGAAARWGKDQSDLPLPDPSDDAGDEGDASSIPEGASSIEGDAASNAHSANEQCTPHHTTPHNQEERAPRARAHEAAPQGQELDPALVEVADALAAAGVPDANPHDPVLQTALREAPRESLLALARRHAGKPMTYLLAAMRGRKADAASAGTLIASAPPSQQPHSAGSTGASPVRPREDPIENARSFARNLLAAGAMSEADAERYVGDIEARYQQGVTQCS